MTVPIRFVPRSTTELPFDSFANVSLQEAAELVEPTKRGSDRGRVALLERGVRVESTALNRLETRLTEEEFHKIFDAVLERKPTSRAGRRSIPENESFQRPTKQLEVPEALRDTIAFVYVPRPVEYYVEPLPVPPHQNVYHLRLTDVALVLNALRCHQKQYTGKGVRVAMADSGFYLHPYFIRGGYNLYPTESPGSGPATDDRSGHGTGEVANIFAVAPHCTVYGVKKGFSAAGSLETCIDQNPAVMSNSWGWDIDRQDRATLQTNQPDMFAELVDVESVIRRATVQNICVLFSAGNGHLAFPACSTDVISVGGVTWNEDGTAEASSYASAFDSQLYPGRAVPDVCGLVGESGQAPMKGHIMLPVPAGSQLDGENFRPHKSGTGWGIFSGTSAACPQVAGCVALMKQVKPGLNTAQIRNVLQARAIDITKGKTATGVSAKAGPDAATGAGLIDALKACGYLEGS